jgi:hypothetical protein
MSLTFKQQSWDLNFSALFMKNVLLGHKKLRTKWHSVENTTQIMQQVLKVQ